jgi:hypothetical protein
MANKKGMYIDTEGFKKQVEVLKQKIYEGIIDGLRNSDEFLIGRMRFYIEDRVYKVYDPVVYERTHDLENNVVATIVNNAIYVYIDDTRMDKTKEGVTYPHRVLEGNSVYPYDFVPASGWGNYMAERNWIEPTANEMVEHFQQSGELAQIIILAIKRRLRK